MKLVFYEDIKWSCKVKVAKILPKKSNLILYFKRQNNIWVFMEIMSDSNLRKKFDTQWGTHSRVLKNLDEIASIEHES